MNVFELFAKLSVDSSEYEKGLNDAEKKAFKTGQAIGNGIKGIGKGIGAIGSTAIKVGATAVKGITTAVSAAGAALTPIVKGAVDAYANYEQLAGGVETLFGKSADAVKKNADAAFKTAGLSANEYMETVTSFSASLLQSLGGDTDAAAKVADQAIVDMADNANKMGTSMESIQNAYQGFAKQNYTMLDNLKLGYGGTKEEMQRLLDDAGKLSGMKFEMGNYADIIQAIHVIQDNMGIAGATSEEAATTIQGSMAMMKSAWQNTLTAIGRGDKGAIDKSINSLVSSVETVAKNIMPVIERSIGGIANLIDKVVPVITNRLPSLVNEIIPPLLNAGTNIINALINALPGLATLLAEQVPVIISKVISAIMDNLNEILFAVGDIVEIVFNAILEASESESGGVMLQILDAILGVFKENYLQLIDMGIQILMNIINGIITALPDLMASAREILTYIVNAIIENLPMLVETGLQLILMLAQGIAEALPELIPMAVDALLTFVTALIDNIDLLIDAALQLVLGLVEGILNALPVLIEKAPEIVVALVSGIMKAIPKILEAATKLVFMLIEGIVKLLGKIVEVGAKIVNSIKEGFWQKVEEAKQWGKDLIDNLLGGIKEKWNALKDTVSNIAGTIKDFLGFSEPDEGPLSNFHTFAPDMMDLFMKGITDNTDKLRSVLSDSFNLEPQIKSATHFDTSSSVARTENSGSTNITVVLQGDAAGIFKVVRVEDDKFIKSNGHSAFGMV